MNCFLATLSIKRTKIFNPRAPHNTKNELLECYGNTICRQSNKVVHDNASDITSRDSTRNIYKLARSQKGTLNLNTIFKNKIKDVIKMLSLLIKKTVLLDVRKFQIPLEGKWTLMTTFLISTFQQSVRFNWNSVTRPVAFNWKCGSGKNSEIIYVNLNYPRLIKCW